MTKPDTVAAPGLQILTADEVDQAGWMPFQAGRDVWIKSVHATPRCAAGLLRLDHGAHEVRHAHPGDEHHVWVVSGTLTVDGQVLTAGAYVHVPPGATHTFANDSGAPCTFFFVDVTG